MTTHELIKLLDNTFPDIEFDIFTDTEGFVRVNFCVDEDEEGGVSDKEKEKENR